MSPAALAAVRARLGLSLDEMGAALGIDRMTWWNWEKGRKPPRQPVILERALRQLQAEAQGRGQPATGDLAGAEGDMQEGA